MSELMDRSVSAASTKEAADGDTKTRSIEEIGVEQIDRFTQCWNQHDAGSFAALFDENGDFVNIGGHRAAGRTAIRLEFLALHSNPARTSVLTNPRIGLRMLAPDVAVTVTRWRLENRCALEPRQGSGIYILVKRGQQWRIRNARMAGIVANFEPRLAGAA